jgi:PAS domain S-box-containing protein
MWNVAKASKGLAGPNSFAVLFDDHGIRIAHTYSDDIMFHPGGMLDTQTIDEAVAEGQFGDKTRELLGDVRTFPQQFDRSRASAPDPTLFRGFAPVNRKWNYGVARRLETVHWTLFYMIPEESLDGPIAAMSRRKIAFAGAIILLALAAGALFARAILRPIRFLAKATESLGTDALSARVDPGGVDEIGRLGTSFNAMAARIEEQDTRLRRGRDELEEMVRWRTADLHASEERLRITLDSIADAVMAVDLEGRVVRMNPVAEKLTGWPFSEAKGKALGEVFCIVNEGTRAIAESPVDLVLREGAVVGLANHTLLIARDGSEYAIADSGAPILDARGEIRGVVLVFHDETAGRTVDRALRESEARFRRLTESGLIGIVLSDTTGTIHEANDAFLRIVGYTREELRAGGIGGAELNAPGGNDAQEAAREQLMAHGVAQPWEKEFVRKDGSRAPVLIGVTMLEPPNCLCIVLDLTERKRAEAAIQGLRVQREADAKFRALLEAAPDAMVIVTPGGDIALVNDQTEKLFGYTRDELLGHNAEILVPVRQRDKRPGYGGAYFTNPQTRSMGEGPGLYGLRRDGSEFPIEISVSPIETPEGLLVSSAVRDITDRKRAEVALRVANAELEAFSYSVAHDLRAPLRGMNGFAQILLDEYKDELDATGQDCLREIHENAVRMGGLIDALLSLAWVNRRELKAEWTDMTAIVRTVANQLAAADRQRLVEVVVEERLSAYVDPRLCRSLLDNLLGNAWKFTGKVLEPRVEFGSVDKEGVRGFFVRDNGAGFDMAHAKRLFGPFQRLHTVREFQGTGIGLATAQRIVHRHGGRIWAEGSVDAGATFYFTLPSTSSGDAT